MRPRTILMGSIQSAVDSPVTGGTGLGLGLTIATILRAQVGRIHHVCRPGILAGWDDATRDFGLRGVPGSWTPSQLLHQLAGVV
jgi:hypothetical protein